MNPIGDYSSHLLTGSTCLMAIRNMRITLDDYTYNPQDDTYTVRDETQVSAVRIFKSLGIGFADLHRQQTLAHNLLVLTAFIKKEHPDKYNEPITFYINISPFLMAAMVLADRNVIDHCGKLSNPRSFWKHLNRQTVRLLASIDETKPDLTMSHQLLYRLITLTLKSI